MRNVRLRIVISNENLPMYHEKKKKKITGSSFYPCASCGCACRSRSMSELKRVKSTVETFQQILLKPFLNTF